MAKRDDEQQERLEKQFKESGTVPDGWQLDPIAEMKGGARFRRITLGDAEDTAQPNPTGTPSESEP